MGSMAITPIIVGFGIPMAVRRRAASYNAGETMRTVYRIIPFMFPLATGFGIVATIFLIPGLSSTESWLFIFAMACSSFFVCTLCIQSVLISTRRYSDIAVLQSIQVLVLTTFALAGWALDTLSVSLLLAGYATGTAASTLVGVLQLRIRVRGPAAPARDLIREGSRFLVSQIAESASVTLYQILAVTAIGSAGSGYLAIALTISGLPLALAYAIGAVAFREVAISPRLGRNQKVEAFARICIVASLSCTTILAIIAPLLIPIVFGSEFHPAILPTLVTLVGCAPLMLNYVCTQMLAALGRGRAMTTSQLVGLAFGVALIYGLGSAVGTVGAAIAVLVAWLTTTVLGFRALGVHYRSLVIGRRDVQTTIRVLLHGKLH